MKAFSCVRGAARLGRILVVFISAMFLGSLTAAAQLEPGKPAPPLQFTQLLQAPPGATTDWDSLRGKVVVLEFWFSQCEPCIEEIPHLSKLIAELDPAKFQFISVDGLPLEDEEAVQKFLTKRKMSGWVGVDTSGSVAKSYGIRMFPMTVIVDGQGRIVAVTNPQDLTAEKLQAVAEGKTIKFAPIPDISMLVKEAKGKTVKITRMLDMDGSLISASSATDEKPLLEFSLTKAPPSDQKDVQIRRSFVGKGHMDISGLDAKALISFAYRNLPKDRFLPTSVFPEGIYNLHTAWATGEDNDNQLAPPFLQVAITYGLNLQVESKTVTKKVYVLKAIDADHKLLTPTDSTDGGMSGYWNGKLKLVTGSMDDLASGLEGGLEIPVINETGIEGKFDAELEFPAMDVEAAKVALLKTMGLDLIEAERPIQMLEVSPREEARKAAGATPQEPAKK